MPPVVYRLPGMDNVSVRSNLIYSDNADPNLLMDVYAPPSLSKDERLPAVLAIHGGAGAQFKPKDWGIYQSWGRLIAASGMAGVVFTHRLSYPKPMLSEAGDDLRNAISYIRANAGSLNIDPDRLCLSAWSAGGVLLAPAMREKPPYVRCLAAFYPLLDIRPFSPYKDNESPESLRAFSPLACFEGDAPPKVPLFIARAGLDQTPTLNISLDRFASAALAANAPVTVINHPDGEHAFDNQNDDDRSREIVRAALDFMKTHLGLEGGPRRD
jgi:acetyl esterase/lipase